MINLKLHTQSRHISGWEKLDFWDKSKIPSFQVFKFDFLQISPFISKTFQSQTFPLTFVLLKTHCKDPMSYESSKELLPHVCWLNAYFRLVCLFPTWNERQVMNDEMKFLLSLKSNHFLKYMMENVVNIFNNNIICSHLIVTSKFPQK